MAGGRRPQQERPASMLVLVILHKTYQDGRESFFWDNSNSALVQHFILAKNVIISRPTVLFWLRHE